MLEKESLSKSIRFFKNKLRFVKNYNTDFFTVLIIYVTKVVACLLRRLRSNMKIRSNQKFKTYFLIGSRSSDTLSSETALSLNFQTKIASGEASVEQRIGSITFSGASIKKNPEIFWHK